MFKRILCAALVSLILLTVTSCFTPLDFPEDSEEGSLGGVIYYSDDDENSKSNGVIYFSGDTENSNGSVGDGSSADTSTEEPSEDTSYDTELKIPTTITASNVDKFYDGSVFVGNSIMVKYEKFVNKYRASSVSDFLGTAKFFCGGSFGVYHNNHTPATAEGAVNPTYQGTKYSVQDMVGVVNPKRVLINLAGLNDMGIFSVDNCASETANEMIKLLKDLRTKYPNVEVVVLSTTYMIKSYNSMSRLNNENLSIMNNLVLDYCNANGIDFVDISSLLVGDNGCLNDEYCSDPTSGGCHLNDKGCLVWTGLLRNYAAKKLTGTYKNPQSMPALSKG